MIRRLRAHLLIDVRCGLRILSGERYRDGYRIHLETPQGAKNLDADVVVNCSWEERARLDATVAVTASKDLCYRIKHRALVKPRGDLSAFVPVTMVQGPYGDLVPLKDGLIYLSWYPECRTYFGSEVPAHPGKDEADAVAARALAAMTAMFPALEGAEIVFAGGCIIVAKGATDVGDASSGLHERRCCGPSAQQGWWTIDNGKFTTAPLNAELTTAAQIVEYG